MGLLAQLNDLKFNLGGFKRQLPRRSTDQKMKTSIKCRTCLLHCEMHLRYVLPLLTHRPDTHVTCSNFLSSLQRPGLSDSYLHVLSDTR